MVVVDVVVIAVVEVVVVVVVILGIRLIVAVRVIVVVTALKKSHSLLVCYWKLNSFRVKEETVTDVLLLGSV